MADLRCLHPYHALSPFIAGFIPIYDATFNAGPGFNAGPTLKALNQRKDIH